MATGSIGQGQGAGKPPSWSRPGGLPPPASGKELLPRQDQHNYDQTSRNADASKILQFL